MASAQEASSSNSLNSISNPRTCKYDIFLSFRGEDTRKSIISHLYSALRKKGFKVFMDDKELEKGEFISENLLQAIEDSHFAIVVLSKNYASSSWCLNELQHILHSRNNLGQQVFPIFYDVDPSDVRHQRGSFAEAFAKYQMLQRDNEDMNGWRDSLTKVANLSGWHYKDGPEAELIDVVVEELWTKLRYRLPPDSEKLSGDSEKPSGIYNKLEQLRPVLQIGLNSVQFVGKWGSKTGLSLTNIMANMNLAAFLPMGGQVQKETLKFNCKVNFHVPRSKDTYEGKKTTQNRRRKKKF